MGFHSAGWWSYIRSDGGTTVEVTWPVVKRVFLYARPYWPRLLVMLVIILGTTGLGLLTPLILRDLIDSTLPNGNVTRLNVLAAGLVLIPLVTGGLRVVQRKINATVGEGVIYDLRVSIYEHLQRMSLRFFTHTQTGELMSRLNNDVVGAKQAISNTVVDVFTNLIQVAATLVVMFTLEWRLTIVGMLVLPLFIIAARRLGRVLRQIRRETMQVNAQMNAMMNETLNVSGALLVKLFGHTQTEVNRFDERAGRVRNMGIRRATVASGFFVLLGLVGAVGTALVYWLGGHLVLRDIFTIGTIVAFSAYLTQLYGALQGLTNAPVEFATSVVSFERVFEVLDLPLDIDTKPEAVELGYIDGRLIFESVTFKYEINPERLLTDVQRYGRIDDVQSVLSGDDAPGENGAKDKETEQTQARERALVDIDFTIEPGQLVALVGPSGAGKTTMTYLIPRLYDPNEGRILIDDYDLRNVTLKSLSDKIGMVTQETYLFHDTIRTNLLYARPDATQQELEIACQAANIHDFIMGLPDRYDTVVGERGYRLSGGEKQRLAIARVILKDPRILVLDEATSHLDSQSEALIQAALDEVMSNRTSVVIAHRLSTILAADQILVMDRGRIVERGTHADLLELDGLYAQLYQTQFSRDQASLEVNI